MEGAGKEKYNSQDENEQEMCNSGGNTVKSMPDVVQVIDMVMACAR